MDKKKWNALCRDMLPLLEEMTEILNNHEYERIFSPAVSADGYINMFHVDGNEHYRLYKMRSNCSAEIELNSEDIKEETDEN